MRKIILFPKFLLLLFLILGVARPSLIWSQVSVENIVDKLDQNRVFSSAEIASEMRIHIGDEMRIKKMISYTKGENKSYAEIIYPARDAGIKYLKIGDNLWMYLPSVEKVIKIAGNMLRQSMLGSDMSYEDALERSKLKEKYTIKLVGEETIKNEYLVEEEVVIKSYNCYVLELTAKVLDVTYYKRIIWVEKNYFVTVREELFAKSGKKLKITNAGNIQQFGDRYLPTYSLMRNLLRQNTYTEVFFNRVDLNAIFPDNFFSESNLKR
jgi:outer membrane lipoprotein-sorting protein